ncbi:MAG TPA: carboxypeptidase-like regulatory domain-containing protein [Blastocatellia bacterium]|nr:carboxypeptidase-like regulatory domain-containing protein [Blastocatellia bacterium]
MKHASRLWALLVVGVVLSAGATAQAGAATGSIRGLVLDARGNPLVGAAVLVLAEDVKAGKVIKKASTDNEGKFIAANIVPGRYRVKAAADGFKPVEIATDVRPNQVTVFDSIYLRRVTTLSEQTSLNTDSKYAARGARNVVFHYDEYNPNPTDARGDDTVALTDRTPEMHGVVNTFAQASTSDTAETMPFFGTNFAISEQIGKDANFVLTGQAGVGTGAPQKLQALTTANVGDRHRFAVALGYGRFTFSRHGSVPRLGQFSLSATDTWQVAGPVLIVYGLEFARFSEGASGTSVLPRLGLAIDATPRTRLSAALVPGTSSDVQSRVKLEAGEIEFTEPKAVAVMNAASGDQQPLMDRSYRLQFGAEQILSDKSSVEMMAFFDTVSGHGVGLLAVPNDAQTQSEFRAVEQGGRQRGMRVVYHRHVNRVVEASVGYAFGEGQQLDERGITDPAHLFRNAVFQVVSAKVDANFVTTGTRVSTVLRVAPTQAVFAIDPFQGQVATYDPNINVMLTQDLPSLGFLPGQWQAIIDLRNLLDQQGAVSDERQELVASRFHRLVRVGLSLRF